MFCSSRDLSLRDLRRRDLNLRDFKIRDLRIRNLRIRYLRTRDFSLWDIGLRDHSLRELRGMAEILLSDQDQTPNLCFKKRKACPGLGVNPGSFGFVQFLTLSPYR
jgi:hypothetical protein